MYKNNTQRKYVPLTGVSEDDTIYLFRMYVHLRVYVRPFGIGVPGGFSYCKPGMIELGII